ALAAIRSSTVPWCGVIVRKAFGMAALSQRGGSTACQRFAWPSAQWGSLPIAGGVYAAYRAATASAPAPVARQPEAERPPRAGRAYAAYRADIDAAPGPVARQAEIEARLEAVQSPLRTAEASGVEEIIDPRDTRRHLCRFAGLAAPLRAGGRGFGYRP